MQDYLKGLNDRQRIAVEHIDGPLMIVAGAGSGKTKVLTTRIAHLMHHGIDAFNILALTFTNKAAAELFTRYLRAYSGLRPTSWATPTTLLFMIRMMRNR